ncbi:MAG: Uncharacterized protein Athens071426_372 [Parcubacteria group bacterium Athens0714_26]|nr:MAG: Uncharacterized protein Athens101426_533 [Parcubacteria group bacterium Athens1014_26]TSD02860.1 MAG: Uncharacterized protein Athens071426_372 [Parcubacteria group bacterium Athens0714_26]
MNFIARVKNLDWVLNFSILFIALASLVSLYSTDKASFYKQLIWYVIGLVLIFVFSQVDWRPFLNYSRTIWGLYVFSVVLLVATYFFAPRIHGTKGWLVLGPFQFQTSEFSKFVLIVVFSWFWAKAHIGIAYSRNIFISFLYLIPPILLVLMQPDMGSALILFGIWFSYLLISGIKWKHLAVALLIFLIASVFLWMSYLKDYQKERIIGLFYPERDPLGFSYNVIQSKIAIGSAGLWGKGFGQGTQSQLKFLPEAQTDFIFAAFIEEWGLIGGLMIIIAFMIILARIVRIGLVSENNFSRLFCLGSVVLLLLHFILNAGSDLGLVPVVGVPFPFLSYGGSYVLTLSLIVGIIQGIVIRTR